jgi:hypothetical protein
VPEGFVNVDAGQVRVSDEWKATRRSGLGCELSKCSLFASSAESTKVGVKD